MDKFPTIEKKSGSDLEQKKLLLAKLEREQAQIETALANDKVSLTNEIKSKAALVEQKEKITITIEEIKSGKKSTHDGNELFNPDGTVIIPGKKEDQVKDAPKHDEPTKDQSQKKEKMIFKAAVVNATALMEAQARDIGDAEMSLSKEDQKKSWIKRKINAIWKHNLAQEYYRQKAIAKARNEILETHNLYVGEKDVTDADESKQAMNAIVERFTSEYRKETLNKEEFDDWEALNKNKKIPSDEINALIRKYADPAHPMSDAEFEEQKKRIISKFDPTYGKTGEMHADNLHEIAKNVRQAVAEGQKLEELDFDVELTLGKTKGSLNTEAHHNAFDKMVEKAQNGKVGKYLVNVPGALAVYGGLYSAAKYAFARTMRTDAAKIATFGVAAVVAGGMAASKEAARLNRERAQHARERAKGMTFEGKEMKRRESMDKSSYETKSASDITTALKADMEKISAGHVDEPTVKAIMANLADLEARVSLGDEKGIDLVTYSRYSEVEKEKMALAVARAELKVAIKKGVEAHTLELHEPTDFDTYLSHLTSTQTRALKGGEKGITAQNRAFNKMKFVRTGAAFLKSAIIGASIGAAIQEVHAAFAPEIDNIVEGISKHMHGHGGPTEGLAPHATALEALRRHMTGGEVPRMPMGLHEQAYSLPGGAQLHMPEGSTMTANADGSFNIMRGTEVLEKHVTFQPNGDLTPESRALLVKHGIFANFSQETIAAKAPMTAEEYLAKHPEGTTRIHRGTWYDNDTEKFDQNELRETWGGVKGTGVDEHGNYVFSVKGMTAEGSAHAGDGYNAVEGMKNHEMKMVFSLSNGTQHQVFEVPIDEHGNAIIDKNSDIAKLMFATGPDGHAVFKGAFAEVAESVGKATDGAENVNILATHIGSGEAGNGLMGDAAKTIGHIKLDLPENWDYEMPYMFPAVIGRRPLEEGKTPDKKKADTHHEEIPKGGFRAEENLAPVAVDPGVMHGEEDKKGKELSALEYAALREDLDLINRTIQSGKNHKTDPYLTNTYQFEINHTGISALKESDFKSELGKKMYRDLSKAPQGFGSGQRLRQNPHPIGTKEFQAFYDDMDSNPKSVTFNGEELLAIGDGLERALRGSTIKKEDTNNNPPKPDDVKTNEPIVVDDEEENAPTVKKNEKQKVSAQEYEDLQNDMKHVSEKIKKHSSGPLTVKREDIKSEAVLKLLEKIKPLPAGQEVTFTKAELGQVADELDKTISNSEVNKNIAAKKRTIKNSPLIKQPEIDPTKTLKLEKTKKPVSDPISDEDYEKFTDKNIVSDEVLKSIAEKTKTGAKLSPREVAISAANMQKIEELLKNEAAAGAPEKVITGEEFIKSSLERVLKETFKQYPRIVIPKDAFNNLVFKDGAVQGDLRLMVRAAGNPSNMNETKLTNFKIINKDGRLEANDNFTFVNPKESPNIRGFILNAMKKLGDAIEGDLETTSGKKVLKSEFKDGKLEVTYE